MKNLLVTCFEPFGGETVNASREAVRLLPARIGAWTLTTAELPVVFGEAAELAVRAAQAADAEAIVCVGQAAGRDRVTPELVALNLQYARIPDNRGDAPRDLPVVPVAREAYFSTLPVRAMAEAITAKGLPAALSTSAGIYVCNDLYYRLLHRFSGSAVRVAFIHVPQVDVMAPEAAAKALALAIAAI